jgi:hypothetical protein
LVQVCTLQPGKHLLPPAFVGMHQLKSPAALKPQSTFELQVIVHHVPLQVPSEQSALLVHGSPMPAPDWQYSGDEHTLPPFSSAAQHPLTHPELDVHESAHTEPVPKSTQKPWSARKLQQSPCTLHESPVPVHAPPVFPVLP